MEKSRASKFVLNGILFFFFLCVILQVVQAVSNNTVLCVSNDQHPFSADICQYYVNARPGAQWLNVSVPLSAFSSDVDDGPWEHMTFANVDSYIRENISNYVAAHPEIRYLAIAKGLPIRVSNNGASWSGISAMWYLAINMSYNYSANASYFDYYQTTASPPTTQNPLQILNYIPINNSRGVLNSYMDFYQNVSFVSTTVLVPNYYLPGDLLEFNGTNFTIIENQGTQNAVYISGPYLVRTSARPSKYFQKVGNGYVQKKGPVDADVLFTPTNPSLAIDSYFFPYSYFVSYLTGYTYADITHMIDRATSNFSYTNEKTVLDYNPATGAFASKFVSNETIPNSLELPMAGSMTATNESVFAYIGWGVHQGKGAAWVYDHIQFNTTNKSVATSIESYNARTFDVAAYATRGTYGGSQGLLADLLSENASGGTNYTGAFTGVFGHVNEPYTSGIILFHKLIPYYLGGLPFAEAAIYAWPYQLTMGISVGDPLMTAFVENETQKTLPAGALCQSASDCVTNMCVQDAFNISRCGVQSSCVLGYLSPKDVTTAGLYASPLFVPDTETRCIQSNFSSSLVQCTNNQWSLVHVLDTNESCTTNRRAVVKSSGSICSSDAECNSYCATDFYGVQRCTDAYNYCPFTDVGIMPANMYYCGGGQTAYCKTGNTTGLKPSWSGYAPCSACDSGICLDYFENTTHYNLSRGKYLVSFPFSVNTTFFPNATTYGPYTLRYDADSSVGITRFGLLTNPSFVGNISGIKNTFVFAISMTSAVTNISIPKQPFVTQPPVQIIRGEYTPITTTVCAAPYNASKLISVMQKFDPACSEIYAGGIGTSIWTSQIMYWYGPNKTAHPFGKKDDFNLSNISGYILRCADATDFALALPCGVSEINLTSTADVPSGIYNTSGNIVPASFTCNVTSTNNLSYAAIISNYTGSWSTQKNISTFNTSIYFSWNSFLVGNTTAQWYCRACDLLDVCNDTLPQTFTVITDFTYPDTLNPQLTFNPTTQSNDSNLSTNMVYVNASIVEANLSNITIWLYDGAQHLVATSVNTTKGIASHAMTFTNLADGVYYFNATAIDFHQNTNATVTYKVTVDIAAPNISYIPYTESTGINVTRNWLAINATANDSTTLLKWMNITVYNGALTLIWIQNASFSAGAATGNISLNLTGLADGLYWYNATATDWAGNVNTTTRRNITIDTTTPNISYVSYTTTNASNLSQTWIAINVTANDTNLRWINITLYNAVNTLIWTQNYSAANGIVTNNLSLNKTGLANGVYYFNATTIDWAGNTNTTPTRNVTLDTLAPNISFVSYTERTLTNNTRSWIGINITANDSNLRYANISVYDSNGHLMWVANTTYATGTTQGFLSLNLTGLPDAMYLFNATVSDWAANTNATVTRTVTIDTTAPNISYSVGTDINASNVTRNWITVNVSANDSTVLLKSMNITVYDNATAIVWSQNLSFGAGAASGNLSLNLTNLSDGVYLFNATAVDWLGNVNTTLTRVVLIDTQNPLISYAQYTDSNNTNDARSWLAVNVTASDTNLRWINISVYSNASLLIWSQNSSYTPGTVAGNISLNLSDLVDGDYYVNTTVLDWSGRSNSTATYKITLNKFTPFKLIYPQNNWTLNVTQMGMRVMFDYLPLNYTLQYWFNNHVVNLSRATNSSSRIDAQIPLNASGFQTLTFTVVGGTIVRNVTLNVTVNYSASTLNDSLIGNESIIVTNLDNLSLLINSSANISGNFTQTQQVEIRHGNRPLILFSHNFTQAQLNLTATVVRTENNSNKTAIVIFGLNHTKSLYVDLIGNVSRDNSLCIKDAPIADFSELTSDCSAANELYISTIPSAFSQYTVSFVNTSNQTILITGLNNSGVQQMCTESWQCGGWSTCSSNSQSRSCVDTNACGTTHTKPSIVQSCTTSGSGGGGGGGGSGAGGFIGPTSLVNKTNASIPSNATGNATQATSGATDASQSQQGNASATGALDNDRSLSNRNSSSTNASAESLAGQKLETTSTIWMVVIVCLVVTILTAAVIRANKSSTKKQPVAMNSNQEIMNYIAQQLARNVSPLDIEKICITKGWDRKAIAQLIQAVLLERKKMQVPKRVHPTTTTLGELRKYVQKQLRDGYTKTEIENALLTSDWEYEDIQSSFK